jgi:O-antigen/teichoic acid export membrane protein
MFRRLIRDILIYGVAGVSGMALQLLLMPLYVRLLGPSDFGVIDMLMVAGTFVNLTAALEITQSVARFCPAAESQAERQQFASTALWFSLVGYSGFVLAALACSQWLSPWLVGEAAGSHVFAAGAVAIFAGGLAYVARNQLRWDLKPHQHAVSGVLQVLLTHGCAVLLVTVGQMGVLGVLLGQILGNAAAAMLAIWWSRSSYRLAFHWHKLREMLAFSLPLVPSGIGVFAALYIDRICIRELMTLEDVGRYGIAYRLASVMALFTLAFQSALGPLIYAHYREPNTPLTIARAFKYFSFLAAGGILLLGLFARELLTLLATPTYLAVTPLVGLLAAANTLNSMSTFTPGLGIAKKTKTIALINLFAAGLNTLLNLLLIPPLGLFGAALATLCAALVRCIWNFAASQAVYPIPHDWKKPLAAIVVTGLLLVATATWSPASAPTLTTLALKVVTLAVATLGFAWWIIGSTELQAGLGFAVSQIRARRSR